MGPSFLQNDSVCFSILKWDIIPGIQLTSAFFKIMEEERPMRGERKKKRLSAVTVFHYFRLVYRSLLFLFLLGQYIHYRIYEKPDFTREIEEQPLIIAIMCAVFCLEMILRFFPSDLESPGCQKQFAKNYIKSGCTEISVQDNNAAVLVLLIWICFNGIFGALYVAGIFDEGIMLIISSAYSVCDIICILFFCPFQTWFLKNKCCSTCRIYNWDYAMMFTPLLFVAKPYTWGLLGLSIALLARWEITFYRFPERFSEQTNDYLKCSNCTEKLCQHKKQLHSLWREIAKFTAERKRKLMKKDSIKT